MIYWVALWHSEIPWNRRWQRTNCSDCSGQSVICCVLLPHPVPTEKVLWAILSAVHLAPNLPPYSKNSDSVSSVVWALAWYQKPNVSLADHFYRNCGLMISSSPLCFCLPTDRSPVQSPATGVGFYRSSEDLRIRQNSAYGRLRKFHVTSVVTVQIP